MSEMIIVGTGALALLFGSKLAAAGVTPNILGTWKMGLDVLEQYGIRVAVGDRVESYPVRVFRDPEEVPAIQSALVVVKSWQTERAAKQIAEFLKPEGVALTIQNGLGNKEHLAKYLGDERTAQGVTTYGAALLEPGLVRPGGDGLISLQAHDRLSDLLDLFQKAKLIVEEVSDLNSLVWSKLIVNVCINPLTALLAVKNGQLLENPAARELMGLIAEETTRVGNETGIDFHFDDPVQAVERVAESTKDNVSSMLQDLYRQAPTEIDVLCGAVVEQGRLCGVDTPYNKLLWKLIKARVELRGETIDEDSKNVSGVTGLCE